MVLVTGATGFLGSELLQQLVEKNYDVKALYRNAGKIPALLRNHPQITWIQGDITDFEVMKQALEGVDLVFHCAAKVIIDEKAKRELNRVNIQGTAQLVDLCLARPHIRLLHVSSIAALGKPHDGALINEKAKWEFEAKSSAYSISKFESELEVWRGIAEGLNAVIVNPSLIIGEKNAGSLSFQFQEMLHKGIPFYPKGGMGIIDVKDVATCMILLMETDIKGERFILSAENYTYRNLLQDYAQAMGVKAPQKAISKLGLTWSYYTSKIWNLLSGTPNPLNKDLIITISESVYFDNQKIIDLLGYQFISVKNSISASLKKTS